MDGRILDAGNIQLPYRLARPAGYDANKKYPVIVDVYGGPHHIHVMATQNRWLLDQWYADQGFVVVAIDGRGTSADVAASVVGEICEASGDAVGHVESVASFGGADFNDDGAKTFTGSARRAAS